MLPDREFSYIDYLDLPDAQRLFIELKNIILYIEGLLEKRGLFIGIKGDWGTGKTSILKALESYFRDYRGFPTLFFEAWRYQDERHPLVPLLIKMEEITASNLKRRLRKVTKVLLGSSLILTDVLLGSVTGMSLGKKIGTKEVKEALSSIEKLSLKQHSAFEENFKTLKDLVNEIINKWRPNVNQGIKKKWQGFIGTDFSKGKYLVLFIDDLDRLLPEKALRLLEMLRFYLNLPQTLVIMGLNDKILARHIKERYRLEEGEEFLEKVFQWSYELSSVPFRKDYTPEIHFRDLRKRAQIDDNICELCGILDPITHRKWVKVANRMETRVKGNRLDMGDAWLSIIEECFPRLEKMLREFPHIKAEFATDFSQLEKRHKDLFEGIKTEIEEDKTFFRFPRRNFDRLIEYQTRVMKGGV